MSQLPNLMRYSPGVSGTTRKSQISLTTQFSTVDIILLLPLFFFVNLSTKIYEPTAQFDALLTHLFLQFQRSLLQLDELQVKQLTTHQLLSSNTVTWANDSNTPGYGFSSDGMISSHHYHLDTSCPALTDCFRYIGTRWID